MRNGLGCWQQRIRCPVRCSDTGAAPTQKEMLHFDIRWVRVRKDYSLLVAWSPPAGSEGMMSETRPPTTTTDSGIPAQSDEYSLTVGPSGPTALHDHYVVQKMQHFNRERVPERVVHAKGSGAHGFFEVPRGRQLVHPRELLVRGRQAHTNVRPFLDGCRRTGLCRHRP
jgi:hypothetical protein